MLSGTKDEQIQNPAQAEEKFTELYDKYFDKVYQFFFFRLRNEQDAEDLTSLTFERIYKNLQSYEERGFSVAAWIFTIARNLMIDFFKKNSIQIDSIEDLPVSKEPSKQFNIADLDRKLLQDELWEVINTLPDKQKMVWSLKLTKDLSHGDIAEIMGTNENHVNVLIHRSTKILKQRLSHLYYE